MSSSPTRLVFERALAPQALRLCVLIVAGLLLAVSSVQAQEVPSAENTYFRPGRPTMEVFALGAVAQPGKWRVETGVPFLDFLAVLGPATASPDTDYATEEVRVQLYRAQGSGRALAFEQTLESFYTSDAAAMPLQAGDLVVVERFIERRSSLFETVQGGHEPGKPRTPHCQLFPLSHERAVQVFSSG